MSNNKTLILLLLTVVVTALTIVIFLPLANIPPETSHSALFMVALLLFKIAGAISAGVLLMLVISDRPWRKLRHNDDVIFARYQHGNSTKPEPFNHAYNGHSQK